MPLTGLVRMWTQTPQWLPDLAGVAAAEACRLWHPHGGEWSCWRGGHREIKQTGHRGPVSCHVNNGGHFGRNTVTESSLSLGSRHPIWLHIPCACMAMPHYLCAAVASTTVAVVVAVVSGGVGMPVLPWDGASSILLRRVTGVTSSVFLRCSSRRIRLTRSCKQDGRRKHDSSHPRWGSRTREAAFYAPRCNASTLWLTRAGGSAVQGDRLLWARAIINSRWTTGHEVCGTPGPRRSRLGLGQRLPSIINHLPTVVLFKSCVWSPANAQQPKGIVPPMSKDTHQK